MIITRYALHKITDINESVFSQMWKRQLAGKDFYSFFTEDGKVDISDNGFIKKYSHKIIPEELKKLEDKINKKKNKTSTTKKTVKKKEVKTEEPKKRGRPKKPIEPKKNKPLEPVKDEELSELARRATIAKHKSEIYKSEKAAMELRKARAELAELDTIGQTCIGFLVALCQNILDQPRGFIDEIIAGIKSGKSKTALTDIARGPATDAISETIDLIEKELKKYKRDVKSDNR